MRLRRQFSPRLLLAATAAVAAFFAGVDIGQKCVGGDGLLSGILFSGILFVGTLLVLSVIK